MSAKYACAQWAGQDDPSAFAGVTIEHIEVKQAGFLCLASFPCSVPLREQIFISEFPHVRGCKPEDGLKLGGGREENLELLAILSNMLANWFLQQIEEEK